MADSTQIFSSLFDLGDTIRAIEKESGQPSQLVVKVGDNKFLVGDLRTRAGEYRLEMEDRYKPHGVKQELVENPHKRLAGTYGSFSELRQAVKSAREQTDDFKNKPHLFGTPDHGYSVGVPGTNLGLAGGRTYIPIGRIIFPLLQDSEKVHIQKLN